MLAGAVPSEPLFVANILADAVQTRLQVRRPSRSYREPREIGEKPVHLRLGEICVVSTKALGRLCTAPWQWPSTYLSPSRSDLVPRQLIHQILIRGAVVP